MKVVFVSGPFRAANAWLIEQNVRRAEGVALALWRLGAAVVCPHTNTRFYQGAAPDDLWLRGDLAILERCDGMVLIEGWKFSVGSRDERAHAYSRKIPVFEWPQDEEAIKTWLKETA